MIRIHATMRRRARAVIGLGPILLPVLSVSAHDSWVIPKDYQMAAPGVVRAAFVTGDRFPAGEAATKPERVLEWTAQIGHSKSAVADYKIEGAELVAQVTLRATGTHIVAVALALQPIEMEAAKFEEYLAEEHATQALELRKAMGESGKPGRERYVKYAKTFVRVGLPGPGNDYAIPVGHRLEIVPQSDPLQWATGDQVAVKVLFDGRPAPHVWVSSGGEASRPHTYDHAVETDKEGLARLPIEQKGQCFLRAHVIRRMARGDPTGRPILPTSSMDADWESFWASMTFRVGQGSTAESEPALREVREVHGAAGPWAVAGYRMGQRALRDLSLSRGTFDLEVVHESPMQVQYTCVADGIQAATGATLGRLNLRLVEATLDKMKTVFRNKSSGRTVTITLTESFMKQFANVPMQELEAKGRIVAGMKDEEIMVVSTKP